MSFEFNNQTEAFQLVQRVIFPFNTIVNEEITIDKYFEHFYVNNGFTIKMPDGFKMQKRQYSQGELFGQKSIITGVMGSGKSTFLLWLFNNAKKDYENQININEPIIFNLSDLLINNELKEYLKGKENCILFIDSLDETILEFKVTDIKEGIDFLLDFKSIVIACRTPFFYDFFNAKRRTRLSKILHLEPLSAEQQSYLLRKYLENPYLREVTQNKQPIAIAEKIINKCKGGKPMENYLVSTPLFTALSAIVATTNSALNDMSGVVELYSIFISDFSKRKFGDSKHTKYLSEIAFNLSNANINRDILSLRDIEKTYGNKFSESIKDFVQLRKNMITDEDVIVDFRHRSIGEYLIAKYILNSLSEDAFNVLRIKELFNRLYNYEISFFIRSLFKDLKLGDREKVFNEFKSYIELNLGSKDFKEILAVHNCIYFFAFSNEDGKIFAEKLARDILDSNIKIHPLIYGTFLSALISYNMYDLHKSITTSRDSSEQDILWNRNLNYHLFYYGDSDFSVPTDFVKKIDKRTKWENTRNVLLYRLESEDERRIQFRGFDITTMRLFLQKTNFQLTQNENARLKDIINTSSRWLLKINNQTVKNTILDEIELLNRILDIDNNNVSKTESMKNTNIVKIGVDVGIITIVAEELAAVTDYFKENNSYKETTGSIHARRFYLGKITNDIGSYYNIASTQAIEQGNRSVISAYNALAEEYNPNIIVLLGIAGSIKKKVKICDVVIADSIYYYDKRTIEESGSKHRIDPYKMNAWIKDLLNYFHLQKKTEEPYFVASKDSYRDKFTSFTGPIGSGEAVIKYRDAEERIWLESVNDKTLALETEASGFSQQFYEDELNLSRKAKGIFVIRGISDHADFKKDDKWRLPASINAMKVLVEILRENSKNLL